jgi:hypothetical protein
MEIIDRLREDMKRDIALHMFNDLLKKGRITLEETLDWCPRRGGDTLRAQVRIVTC